MRTTLMSLALSLATGLFAAAAEADTAFPVHGNWCGPMHSGGPVHDPLDAACRRHDICYGQVRNLDCGCDLIFMDELRHLSWPSQAAYLKGRAVYEAIAVVPCFGTTQQQATKLAWLRNDTAGAVARGREARGAAFERVMRLIGTGLANAYMVEE